jgi:hypothetical protein
MTHPKRPRDPNQLAKFIVVTIPAHFHQVIIQLSPEQRRDRTAVNEAVRLADPDLQR